MKMIVKKMECQDLRSFLDLRCHQWKNVKFKLGLDFSTKLLGKKKAIHNNGLCQGKPMWIDKDDKYKLMARCKDGCLFYLRISLDTHR